MPMYLPQLGIAIYTHAYMGTYLPTYLVRIWVDMYKACLPKCLGR